MELQPLKMEFHQKFYPMRLIHRDRNYIYNFWPHEGESFAQAWGRLKSMLYSWPNHELTREVIMQSFYARLSDNNRTMLDTSCAGSFMMKTMNLDGIYWIELNATLKIGTSTKVRSEV